ncbi:MAG TPA: hypothetical protein VLK85_01935 [Ramlibacter sp.]|nr:hypothetical protein [Ramlibacter sp.]
MPSSVVRERLALACLAPLAGAAFLRPAPVPAGVVLLSAALLAYASLSWRRVTLPARVFVALAACASILAIALGTDAVALLGPATQQAAQFATLLAALATLRLPMRRSVLIGRAAAWLVASPPRRRYAALTYGSHFLTLMFGVGVVPMIGDMLARRGLDCRESAAARQMLLAVVRGLAWATLWSPMAVSFAIVSSALPTLDPLRFVGVGLLMALSLLLLSCLFFGQGDVPVAASADVAGGGRALCAIAAMSALLFLATWALYRTSGLSFLLASAITVPCFSLAWWRLEPGERPPLVPGLAGAVLELRSETLIFSASAFIGQGLLALLLPDAGRHALALPVGPYPFAVLCVLAVPAVAAFAVAPTIVVLLLAQLVAASGIGVATPLTFAVALTAGWSLAIGISTVSATLLLASNVSALPARQIAFGLNRGFTLVMTGVAVGLVSVLYALGW